MFDAQAEIKSAARVLHRQARAQDPAACARLRRLAELRDLDDARVAASVKRRHCLSALARDLGFVAWAHLVAAMRGEGSRDFGTLLYPDRCGAHLNIWSADYDEAKAIHAEHGGYLLAFRRDFLIVDRFYIVTLGLDPDDPDWARIGHDWAKPRDAAARARLFGQLIRAQLADTASR